MQKVVDFQEHAHVQGGWHHLLLLGEEWGNIKYFNKLMIFCCLNFFF